jgi:hypothetical protein
MATREDFGGQKDSGHLVESGNWNDLVTEVLRLDAAKADLTDLEALRQTIIDTLQPAIATLTDTVGALEQTVQSLDGRVTALEAIRDQHYLLTLETSGDRFVVGSVAQITGTLMDLEGNPLTFPNAADRPWVDFVTTWGIIQAAPGFEARAGAESRAVTVRANQNGTVRVHLRADTAVGITEQDQIAVQQMLFRRVNDSDDDSRTVQEMILLSATPIEARDGGAFKVIDAEYSSGNPGVMRYVDEMFRNELRARYHGGGGSATFEDRRATILAFVKADNDPRTPDATRGASTTQITFREWTRSYSEPPIQTFPDDDLPSYWFPPIHELPEPLPDPLGPLINVAERVEAFLDNVLDVDGEIARYRRIRETVDWLGQARPDGGHPDAVEAVDQAMGVLTMLADVDQARVTPGAGSGGVGALVKMAARNEKRVGVLGQQVAGASDRSAAVEHSIGDVQEQVSTLSGQVQATVAEGGAITQALQQVGALEQRVDAFDLERFAPTETRVSDINTEMQHFSERLALLENP